MATPTAAATVERLRPPVVEWPGAGLRPGTGDRRPAPAGRAETQRQPSEHQQEGPRPRPGARPRPRPIGQGLSAARRRAAVRQGRQAAGQGGLPARAASRGRRPAQQAKPKKTKRRLYYIVDVPATQAQGRLVIDLARRERKPDGTRGPLRPWWHTPATAASKVDAEDLQVLELLQQTRDVHARHRPGPAAAATATSSRPGPARLPGAIRRFVLAAGRQAEVIERLCRTGRCRLRRTDGEDDPPGLRWDDGPPWQFWLDVRPESARQALDLARRPAPQARPDGPGRAAGDPARAC